jgi:hypothetical protein
MGIDLTPDPQIMVIVMSRNKTYVNFKETPRITGWQEPKNFKLPSMNSLPTLFPLPQLAFQFRPSGQ